MPRPHRLHTIAVLLLAALAFAGPAADAFARGSSGGYSRPSSSARTPSFGGGSSSPRTPSTSSGGYSRPTPSYNAPAYRPPTSAGDRGFSQDRSGAAFDAYRTQQDNARRPSFNAPNVSPPSVSPPGLNPPSPPAYQQTAPAPRYQAPPPANSPWGQYTQAPARSGWFNDRGYAPPAPGYFGSGRSFGVWDGLFIGALLSNLTRSGSADWFHNNQNDPGYRQWRAEADRQAQDNADLRRQLNDLDRQLAERSGQPKTPGAVPADIPPDLAKPTPQRTPSTGGGNTWIVIVVVLAGAGGIAYLAYQRRRPKPGGSPVQAPPTTALGGAAAMLRHKLSGEEYRPDRFRVGMTLSLDPTPFILAGDALKLKQPEGTGSGQVSVSAIGEVTSGNTKLTRLYLPDERSMVQLHLDPTGTPDECRLFGTIDEITPADPTEWAVWLDPNEGLIGWPQFQTKDGKTYDRVWVPGAGPISPRVLSETIEGLSGTRTVSSRAMLYAAPTNMPDPAPATEYILVEARQDQGRAWVEVRAGFDLNPVTLQLA